MTTELAVLAWGCLLAVVHIFAATRAKTAQYGTKWNMGARDEDLPPLNPLAGRLARAQGNYFETFPIMIAAVAIVSLADLETRWTAIGAMLWLGARIVYLPLYGFGVPKVRTLVWALELVGIGMVLWPALAGGVRRLKRKPAPARADAGSYPPRKFRRPGPPATSSGSRST